MTTATGIVVLFVGPDGEVWAQGTDFEPGSPRDSQEARATNAMRRDFIDRAFPPAVAKAFGVYDVGQIMRRMEGFRVHLVAVGYDE